MLVTAAQRSSQAEIARLSQMSPYYPTSSVLQQIRITNSTGKGAVTTYLRGPWFSRALQGSSFSPGLSKFPGSLWAIQGSPGVLKRPTAFQVLWGFWSSLFELLKLSGAPLPC